ncbi:9063_t:CDS:1, partial [Scutellospora calospora]
CSQQHQQYHTNSNQLQQNNRRPSNYKYNTKPQLQNHPNQLQH